MHVLRLLRIFIPLLLVAAIVAGIVVVVTSRSELQRSRKQVEQRVGAAAHADSTSATRTLAAANQRGATRFPGRCTRSSRRSRAAYADWRDLEQHDGSVTAEVDAANNLEVARPAARASRRGDAPRLQGNAAALGAINGFAAARPARRPRAGFDAAVDHFEQRTQPAGPPARRPDPRLRLDPRLRHASGPG